MIDCWLSCNGDEEGLGLGDIFFGLRLVSAVF
jgi:hypothetical protein